MAGSIDSLPFVCSGANTGHLLSSGILVAACGLLLAAATTGGDAAGAITLTALVSVLPAKNMPDYGRDIAYGATVLVILLLYGSAEPET